MPAAFGVLLGAILVGGLGHAAPSREGAVELEWRAPRGCPDADRVLATIDRLVGPRASSTGSTEPWARVRAVVHAQPEGFRMELHTQHGGATEQRTLAAPRCDALADAAALIVAVALRPIETATSVPTLASEDPRPGATISEPPSSTAPPRRSAPARVGPPSSVASRSSASAEPPRPGTTADAAVRRRAIGGALAVMAGPGFGALPGVAAQLSAALALRGRRWRAELAGAYWFPRTDASTGRPTVEIGLATGALRGCYVPRVRRLELPLCAGLEAGAMRGEGRGSGVVSRPSRAPWVAAHAGSGLVVPLGAFTALRLSVDALVALAQPAFDLRIADARVELYRAPPAGVRAAAGFELRWP